MYGTEKEPAKVLLTPFGEFIPFGTDLPEFDDYDHNDWYAILMAIVIANHLYMDTGEHQIIIDYHARFYFRIIIPETFYALRGDGTYISDTPQFPYATRKDDNTTFIHTLS